MCLAYGRGESSFIPELFPHGETKDFAKKRREKEGEGDVCEKAMQSIYGRAKVRQEFAGSLAPALSASHAPSTSFSFLTWQRRQALCCPRAGSRGAAQLCAIGDWRS